MPLFVSYYRQLKSGDDNLRHSVIKTVAAFLNSNGGHLLIGVGDNQEVTGIEKDDFKDTELYVRRISEAITSALGETASSLTTIEINEFKNKLICVVECIKSKKPIYCNFKNFGKDQTFVRTGNVTAQPPSREWVDYCNHHFE